MNLIEVYNNVVAENKAGQYINGYGETIPLLRVTGKKYKNPGTLSPDNRMYEDFPTTRIYVQNIDFLDKAVELSRRDSEAVAILNPASEIKSGGGVRKGSRALEEIICRRSTLLPSLEDFANQYGYYEPILNEYEAIYSPGVQVYKDSGYNNLPLPWSIGVISAAALRKPNNPYTQVEEEMMKEKIRLVLRVAILEGKVDLVLPAWGCGAFGNAASEVARCFNEVFGEPEFQGAFREICFAILDDHNAVRPGNPEGNYVPFTKVFSL